MKLISVLLLLVALGGCAGSARIEPLSPFAAGDRIDRLVVIHDFYEINSSLERAPFAKPIEDKLKAQLLARGVDAIILGIPKVKALDAIKANHGAQALLIFQFMGGTVSIAGQHYTTHFHVRMIDRSDRLIWEAKLVWEPGGNAITVDERASTLVREVITALERAGIVARPLQAQMRSNNRMETVAYESALRASSSAAHSGR